MIGGRIDPLITHRLARADAEQALKLMEAKAEGMLKVVLEPNR